MLKDNIHFIHAPQDKGPFDIIGDVHGCFDELIRLMEKLGWQKDKSGHYMHPQKRKICFVGDLVDRGPDSPSVLRLAMQLVKDGKAYWLMGNHDHKLAAYLKGRNVQISHGILETIEQFKGESQEFKDAVSSFIETLPFYAILDEDKLIIAHAGLEECFHFKSTKGAGAFSLFGKSTGLYDENGYPIRLRWQDDYKGKPTIVYGHVALEEPEETNNCINVDTSCVFGGHLTALRWPEKDYVSVKSHFQWERPFIPPEKRQ